MWSIKILNGPMAGKIFPLKQGTSTIGRSEQCDIQIPENGISKNHLEILTSESRIKIKDLNSRNGSFVNGIKVSQLELKTGDKILLQNIMLEIIEGSGVGSSLIPISNSNLMTQNSLIQNKTQHMPQNIPQHIPQNFQPQTMTEKFKGYLESVFLPAIYHLGTVFPYRYVLGLFLFAFALILTLFSIIPIIAVTQESIDAESRRRAFTIARNLAQFNQTAILSHNESLISVSHAELEEGVQEALIIRDSDGTVIAPPEKAGSIPEISLIEKARQSKQELSEKSGPTTIVVSIPISMFSPESGAYVTQAHSVVIYDMGSLALDNKRILSLYVQTLFLSTLIGLVIFYLLYSFVEFPLKNLNLEIDTALRNKTESIQTNLKYPLLSQVIEKINTTLSRAALSNEENQNFNINRTLEAENLIQLVGYAGIILKGDLTIVAINSAFQELLNVSESFLKNQPITMIPDLALQKNIQDLIERNTNDYSTIATNDFEFSGNPFSISGQVILNSAGPEYFLITLMQLRDSS